MKSIPVAARSKASVCSHLMAVFAGGMNVRLLWFSFRLCSRRCDELITRSEEFYRLCASTVAT